MLGEFMDSKTTQPDLARNDPSGGFYEFIPPELSTAVAAMRPSGITRDEYHLSIMRDFIDAVKARKAPVELVVAARSAVFEERMIERLTIGPDVGQTEEELEASLQESSKARLSSVIEAACTYHVEIARKA